MMNIRARLDRLDELANDKWLGISTIEYHQLIPDDRPDCRGYGPTPYRDWRIMHPHLNQGGAFIDFGAGLGRIVVLAARSSFDRVIGVDLDQVLVYRARKNIRTARSLRCPIEIVCKDATSFPVPADASVIYFCNPFVGPVLDLVLDNIRKSFQQSPRDMQIVCNLPPESAFEQQIREVSWLRWENMVPLSGRKCLIFMPR